MSLRRLALALVSWLFMACPEAVLAFGLADVEQRARALAAAPYVKPEQALPEELRRLTYEQYQSIRYKPERRHWHGQGVPIELAFFHRGAIFEPAVRINEVSSEGVREIRYRPDAFDFGSNRIDPKQLQGLGFAGFRLHYALNDPKTRDEFLVFLGASYFRAVGRGQVYGLSARGLAINTAETSGEEFPRFVEFWVDRPAPEAREFSIYALLDSPSVSGAYRFVVRPGKETGVDVQARLYTRKASVKFGLAPLTSMFFFGENQPPGYQDFRPEVHDSDGLSVRLENGEWIWRPLVNPRRLLVSSFATAGLGGFGLQQRDRRFSSYEEPGTRRDLRPGAWIEPQGAWGAGRVELVQIPTPDERNDNIVAYWVPDKPLPTGKPYELRYRIRWQMESEERPPLLWVWQTRRGAIPQRGPEGSITLSVDFAGGMPPPPAEAGEMKITASTPLENATLLDSRLERNEPIDGWRLTLVLRRNDAAKPAEIGARLMRDGKPVSETWSYILPPE